jgi:hypothetical protein
LLGNRWLPQTTCANCAECSGDLLPPSPPAEKATDFRSWLQLLGACNTRSSLGVLNAFTVVQKIALTAIVDQAHNSNE